MSPRKLRRLASEPPFAAGEVVNALVWADDGSVAPAIEGNVVGVGEDRLHVERRDPHGAPRLLHGPDAQGVPIACTALARPGPYALRTSVEGRFYVAAAAFAPSEDVRSCLLPEAESALVASTSAPVQVTANSPTTRDLRLRPLRGTDPPILLALPVTSAAGTARGGGGGREVWDAASA